MKKLISLILLLTILALPLAFAQENLYDRQYLDIEISIESQINMIQKASSYSLDYVTADLYFFPKQESNLQINKFITTPEADRKEDYLQFRWTEFASEAPFSMVSEVETVNWFAKVKHKIPFPISTLPSDIKEYTKPTKTIDSSVPAIIRKATELASGEDDLYVLVSNIAIWVKNNVEYDLSTQTADVSQKASWVLQNKQGVCDELTSLFIAMLRSLGVPAKFISGVAYTTSPQFPENWGAHGWAEVYFPTVGWIPFDPTYGEFGWVDPTHVKLKESFDPSEASTKFTWQARDIDIEFTSLNIKSSVITKGPKILPVISLDVNVLKDKTAFGSYNLVKGVVQNLKDHYITVEIALGRTNDLEVFDNLERQVILRPGESKDIFWRVRLSSDLDERYVYTIPILLYDVMNTTSKTSFTSSSRDPSYSEKEINDLLDSLKHETPKTVSRDLTLDCSTDNEAYAVGEKGDLICTLKNNGNVLLTLDVCFEGNCEKVNLGISQENLVSFDVLFSKFGEKDLIVTAKGDGLSETFRASVPVIDKPVIKIENIEAPSSVKYGDIFEVKVLFNKESVTDPKDVVVIFMLGKKSDSTRYTSLDQDQTLTYSMKGSDLKEGSNILKVKITYEDDKGKQYKAEKEMQINLEKVSFFQKIAIFFKNLF